MSIFDVGRVCVKLAGRDAGKKCVVVENHGNFVLVDGSTRRRKVNVNHLEPLDQTVSLKSGASHADVAKEFEKLGLPVWEKKSKKPAERQKKQKVKKTKAPKAAKKAEKKEAPAKVEETATEEASVEAAVENAEEVKDVVEEKKG